MYYAVMVKTTNGNEFVADFENESEAINCANHFETKYNRKYDVVKHFFRKRA